ncbi:Putative PAP2 domain protein [Aspergillus calidoustus]|uniref:Dolichyldiphosphatase n=1 Tax=Aspergillus calidoustus TaxID=454130 RepID=A0A0U5FUI8_ASPCI|nr:Putative PAP2 domain protein [Aspergillus calidoustus]
MEEEKPLASLSLTHVHYNPEDHLSYLSAWLALVPQALCVVYVTLVWATREVEVGLMFAGQLGCEALNFALKRIIKEERPKQMFGKGYGMPSSHAQFVSFFAVYMGLFLLFRQSSSPANQGPISRAIASLGIALAATAVAVSRIYLTYHTPRQVLAGCAVGVVFALAWFQFTGLLRSYGWIEWGLDHSTARFFRLRDLVVSEDLAEAGWQRWETRRKAKRSENGGRSSSKAD